MALAADPPAASPPDAARRSPNWPSRFDRRPGRIRRPGERPQDNQEKRKMRRGVWASVAARSKTARRRTAGRGKLAVMALIAWCSLSVSPGQGEMITLGQAGDFGVLGLP